MGPSVETLGGSSCVGLPWLGVSDDPADRGHGGCDRLGEDVEESHITDRSCAHVLLLTPSGV